MNKILLLAISFLLLLNSCKNNSVAPTEDKPGRRDYVWTVDTLKSFNPIYRLWGSSPTDVWATTVGTFDKNIYHFDGDKWTTGEYTLPPPPYGAGGHSIYGFAQNDAYIGSGNNIYKFNGTDWVKFAELKKDGHTDIVFNNLWGQSPNDFYALGAYADKEGYFNNSIIAHYLNGKWEMINTNGLFGTVANLYKNKRDHKIYIQVVGGRNYTDSTHIYEYLQGSYINLYSNIWDKGLQADISLINNEVYFILGSKISIRVNNKFQTILTVNNPNFYQKIWGRNSKDIFLVMTDGLVHYNGTDMKYLFNFDKPRTQIWRASIFEKEVFFLVYEAPTHSSLIYHGKLSE